MTDDLDVPRLLVQGRGDAGRDWLEGIQHGGLSGLEQHEIADPDDDEAPGLIRRHDTGEMFRRQRVADPLQLGNAIRRRWRRWWRRRRDDDTLQFDGIAGMQRKRDLGGMFGPA